MSATTNTATVMAVAAAALAFGSGNTFVTKLLITGIGCDSSCAATGPNSGSTASFNKPIFSTLVAFGGMAAGVLYYVVKYLQARYGSKARVETKEALLEGDFSDAKAAHQSDDAVGGLKILARAAFVRYRPLAVPAVMDVFATALQAAASLFIPAAVNAVLRGTILLFTAVANRVMGVRDAGASRREWTAIGISMCGVGLVGLSSVLNNADTGGTDSAIALPPAAMAAVGVSLALLSNVVQAVQVAYETRFLEGAVYEPIEANAAEGVIGVGICAVLLLAAQLAPFGTDNGHVEDSGQTACCIARTPAIAGVSFLLWLLFGFSTIAHMALSLLRGSNFRSFILCGRSLLIWGMEFVAYRVSGGSVGTGWATYTWLEALGFATLVAGGVAQYRAQSDRQRRERDAAAARDASEGTDMVDVGLLNS